MQINNVIELDTGPVGRERALKIVKQMMEDARKMRDRSQQDGAWMPLPEPPK